MKTPRFSVLVLSLLLVLGTSSLVLCEPTPKDSNDWPRFRGPAGSAVSTDTNVPVEFNKTKNLRWKVELPGRGVSSPVVADGRVYVTAASGYRERRLHVCCYDQNTGKKLWERQLASTGPTGCHPTTSMAGPTPVTDGQNVYALFATGDLAGFTRDGILLWYRSLVSDYPDITNQVGMAASPVLFEDVLLLPLENAGDSFAAGIDTKTGKNLWKVKRSRDTNWVTPLVCQRDGRTSAIFQTRTEVTAFEPKTGSIQWEIKKEGLSSVMCPVASKTMLFISGRPFRALKFPGNTRTPKEAWTSLALRTGYTSILYHDGKLYGMTRVGVGCLDARDGSIVWQRRLRGKRYSASPLLVGGKMYVTGEDGTITVIQPGKEARILASNKLEERLMATPAVSKGALFVRGYTTLYCFAHR